MDGVDISHIRQNKRKKPMKKLKDKLNLRRYAKVVVLSV